MKSIKVGKHVIPLWLIATLLISGIGSGVLAYYVWRTLTIPLEIMEPLELLNYPSELSLYAGDFEEFNVTIQNHSSNNYTVILDLHLSNTTYQTSYVTFSNEIYTVTPGQQNLTVWLEVESDAPPEDVSLIINFIREKYISVYPAGLIGYWKFDEGSGTTAYDSSGNRKNGTLTNGPAWVDGKYGKALLFDGTNDYVAIPDLYASSPSSLTIVAWINSPLTGIGSIPFIHHCRNGEFFLNNEAQGYVGTGVKLTNGVWYVISAPTTANVWHHIVGTWIKGDSIKLYIDGTLVNQTSVPNYYLFNAYWENAAIGSRYGWHAFFNGTIDEVMVFGRALNAEEIQTLYTSPPY